MSVQLVPNLDVSYLDERLLSAGRLRILPAAEYQSIDPLHLRIWCQKRAYYCLPTAELVEYLREVIAGIPGRTAIEVGAGNGELGTALGIPITDSHVQLEPWMRTFYRRIGAAVTVPPAHCRRLDAIAAVRKFKPDVCIAAWLTQQGNDEVETPDSFSHGADEEELLRHVGTYIFIGNQAVHGRKKILARDHSEARPDWLVSRAADPSQNVIWIWDGRRGEK